MATAPRSGPSGRRTPPPQNEYGEKTNYASTPTWPYKFRRTIALTTAPRASIVLVYSRQTSPESFPGKLILSEQAYLLFGAVHESEPAKASWMQKEIAHADSHRIEEVLCQAIDLPDHRDCPRASNRCRAV
jgi:hypothetical protein